MAISRVAIAYCEAYDEFQTLFALYRLEGWQGGLEQSPEEVRDAHDLMVARLGDLRSALGMEVGPSYVDRARTLMQENTD